MDIKVTKLPIIQQYGLIEMSGNRRDFSDYNTKGFCQPRCAGRSLFILISEG
jgi:hypothetical protein